MKETYTFRVKLNGGEPLHKTITVWASSEKEAEFLANAKIIREFTSVYSPGKDTLELELVD